MLIDQIIPHLPKYNEEVNTHVKCLQAMLDAATEADPVHDQEDEDQGHKDDHRHSPTGTQLAALLHRRSAVMGMAETTVTCMMSSAAELHGAGLKTDAVIKSMMSGSSAMKGTMTIMAPTMTNLTDSVLQKKDTS
jgi:hypothetical protein